MQRVIPEVASKPKEEMSNSPSECHRISHAIALIVLETDKER